MEKRDIKLRGTSPLMVHSDKLANPLNPLKKEVAEYTRKRVKTDDDWACIFRLEWEGGLYHDDTQPVIPSFALKSCFRSGAKLSKQGRHIQRGVFVNPTDIPIEYDGPKAIKGMWDSGEYKDIRSVVVKGSRVMRCRPLFKEWGLAFTLIVNESVLNMKEVMDIIELTGQIEGLCENRMNGYGRFEIV